jgi:hypothetical protein
MAKLFPTLSRRAFLKLLSQMFGLAAYLRMIWSTNTKVQAIEPRPMTQGSAIEQSPIQAHPYGTGLYGQGLYPEYHVALPLVNKE